eukprot:6394614-Prymnesium_polylepis.1
MLAPPPGAPSPLFGRTVWPGGGHGSSRPATHTHSASCMSAAAPLQMERQQTVPPRRMAPTSIHDVPGLSRSQRSRRFARKSGAITDACSTVSSTPSSPPRSTTPAWRSRPRSKRRPESWMHSAYDSRARYSPNPSVASASASVSVRCARNCRKQTQGRADGWASAETRSLVAHGRFVAAAHSGEQRPTQRLDTREAAERQSEIVCGDLEEQLVGKVVKATGAGAG